MSNVRAFPTSSDRALGEADRRFQQAELVGEYARAVAMATMLELTLGEDVPDVARQCAAAWLHDRYALRAKMEGGRIVGLVMEEVRDGGDPVPSAELREIERA